MDSPFEAEGEPYNFRPIILFKRASSISVNISSWDFDFPFFISFSP